MVSVGNPQAQATFAVRSFAKAGLPFRKRATCLGQHSVEGSEATIDACRSLSNIDALIEK
jgi:hypothetical protein